SREFSSNPLHFPAHRSLDVRLGEVLVPHFLCGLGLVSSLPSSLRCIAQVSILLNEPLLLDRELRPQHALAALQADGLAIGLGHGTLLVGRDVRSWSGRFVASSTMPRVAWRRTAWRHGRLWKLLRRKSLTSELQEGRPFHCEQSQRPA